MINFAKRIFKDDTLHNKLIIILFSFFMFFLKTSFCIYAGETSRFRFAVMGCMHFGVTEPKDYELAVEKIKGYNPDFVMFLGGMVDPMVDKPVKSLWQSFDRITDKLGVPVYNIFSDCRLMPLFIPKDRMVLMEKCFLDRYKKRYYSFEHKNNLFICLDSESLFLDEEKGLVDRGQLDFLKTAISDAAKYDKTFLFVHSLSPLREKIKEKNTEGDIEKSEWFKVIHPIIKEKVKHVFSVYRHNLDVKRIDGVNYVFSGYSPLYINKIPSFLHFLIMDVVKKKFSMEIVPAKPIVITDKGIIATQYKVYLSKIYLITLTDRENILQPSRIIESLKIKPGMDILDIGAGTGFFTFPFAEALKGTGKVFAAEADSKAIEYIENRIKEAKFKNIFPVRVQAKGVDPFYKQRSFDIIFLSETYHCLLNAEDYFRELRSSLEKKRGRLYIIDFKNVSDFSEVEFDDFKEVAKTLISEGERFPIFQRLEKDVQYFIKNWQGEDIPPETQIKIIQDFNRMLSDRWLWPELLDYYFSKEKCYGYGWAWPFIKILYSYDLRLAKWLIADLDGKGIFDRKDRNLNDIDRKQLCTLNRILITGIFKTDKIGDFQGFDRAPIYVEKNRVISTLESAGFKFVREYDFLTHHYFLEFKRKF